MNKNRRGKDFNRIIKSLNFEIIKVFEIIGLEKTHFENIPISYYFAWSEKKITYTCTRSIL